jgi:hypothetical protein
MEIWKSPRQFLALKDNSDQIFLAEARSKQPSNAKAFVNASKSARPLNTDKMENQQKNDIPINLKCKVKMQARSRNIITTKQKINNHFNKNLNREP